MPLEAVDAVCYEPLYVICCRILIQLLNDCIKNIEDNPIMHSITGRQDDLSKNFCRFCLV